MTQMTITLTADVVGDLDVAASYRDATLIAIARAVAEEVNTTLKSQGLKVSTITAHCQLPETPQMYGGAYCLDPKEASK